MQYINVDIKPKKSVNLRQAASRHNAHCVNDDLD